MVKVIFKDTKANTELTLPVTPSSFELTHGISIQTVNIHTLGDAVIAGYGTLDTIKVDCLLPAQVYPFTATSNTDPYGIVKRFKAWCDGRVVLRYIVTDTDINLPVLVNEIKYGEQDGTGDVYAALTLRQYRELQVVETQKSEKTGNSTREAEVTPPPSAETYTVVSGDTLWDICRRFYGEPTLYSAFASYNGLANPSLIYPGQVFQIPDKSLLAG